MLCGEISRTPVDSPTVSTEMLGAWWIDKEMSKKEGRLILLRIEGPGEGIWGIQGLRDSEI